MKNREGYKGGDFMYQDWMDEVPLDVKSSNNDNK